MRGKKLLVGMSMLGVLAWGVLPACAFSFDPAPLLHRASVYLDQGKFLECVETYEQVYSSASSPEDRASALVRMGDVLSLFLEKKEQALTVYQQAIHDFGAFPVTENAYFNTAMILYEQGNLSQAAERFATYIELFPQGRRAATADFMVMRVQDEIAELADSPEPPSEKLQEKPQEKPQKKLQEKLQKKPQMEAAKHVAPPLNIRVALTTATSVQIGCEKGARLSWAGGDREVQEHALTVQVARGKLVAGTTTLGRRCEIVPADGFFSWQGKRYAGTAVVSIDGSRVLLVNVLSLEAYLEGVVPREMLASWNDDALRSQAVAARTYAIYLQSKSGDKPYDVAATTASQVYGGADAGTARTDQAVMTTRGEVLTYKHAPVLSYFHSHSGGMLEDPAQVWTTGMPYYQIRNDQISQRFHPLEWETRISADEVRAALVKNGFHVASVRDIVITGTSASGRWTKVRIVTDSGDLDVKGNSLRIWLGAGRIKSTLGRITRQGSDFVFSGRGFGHGVGLSQWGAQGMARKGISYQDILAHYYPGTSIENAY